MKAQWCSPPKMHHPPNLWAHQRDPGRQGLEDSQGLVVGAEIGTMQSLAWNTIRAARKAREPPDKIQCAPGCPVLDYGLLSHKMVNLCSFIPPTPQFGVTCDCSWDLEKAIPVADPQGSWCELASPLGDCSLPQSQLPVLERHPRPSHHTATSSKC